MYKAKITVTLKKSMPDPQGSAVQKALHAMNYENVTDVRTGKFIEVRVDTDDRKTAEAQVIEMCHRILTNTVIEDYCYELVED